MRLQFNTKVYFRNTSFNQDFGVCNNCSFCNNGKQECPEEASKNCGNHSWWEEVKTDGYYVRSNEKQLDDIHEQGRAYFSSHVIRLAEAHRKWPAVPGSKRIYNENGVWIGIKV
jgi:formate hydrogenlyase subunit 6/NADH:ubiquinone oxidoreductase subunit I